MISLPNLPTGNLYKFFASAGLVLTIFSLTWPLYQILETRGKVSQLEGEVAVLNLESQWLDEDLDRLGAAVGALDKEVTEERSRKSKKARADLLDKRTAELRERNDRLREAHREQQRRKTLSLAKQNELDRALKDLRTLLALLTASGIVGGLISTFGFLAWYRNVQRPQDLLLRQQLGRSGRAAPAPES